MTHRSSALDVHDSFVFRISDDVAGNMEEITVKARHPRRRSAIPQTVIGAVILTSGIGVASAVFASPPLPNISSKVFSVGAYGADANGTTVDTGAIQAAINAAAANPGGGIVELGASAGTSSIYLSGALALKSNVDLQIDSGVTLQMLPKADYTSGTTPFISANNITNAEVTGGGVIDGQGSTWWGDAASQRPFLLDFQNSSTLAFTGVTLLNSPMENLAFNNTNNVTVNGITVSAPADSPNTDGIDPAGYNYLIENSNISTGDDDIAVKPQNSPVSNIVITHDTIESGHGISVGGETNDGLNGMTVSHITFSGTTNGLRLKAGIGNGGLVENITYSDISMQNVANPIYITSYYQNGGDHSPSNPASVISEPLTSTTPIWKNITFSDITATGAEKAGLIYGLPQAPVQNVTLDDVSISAQQSFNIYYAQNTVLSYGTNPQSLSGLVTYDAPISTPEPASGCLFCILIVSLSLMPRNGLNQCRNVRTNDSRNLKKKTKIILTCAWL